MGNPAPHTPHHRRDGLSDVVDQLSRVRIDATSGKVSSDAVPPVLPLVSPDFPIHKANHTLKAFIVDGTAFPMGKHSTPAGFGHTLVFGPENVCVRKLSTLECWLLSGGNSSNFQAPNLPLGQWGSIFMNLTRQNLGISPFHL